MEGTSEKVFDLKELHKALPSDECLSTKWAGKVCPVCKVGKVVPQTSSNSKELTVYGRLGQRMEKCLTCR